MDKQSGNTSSACQDISLNPLMVTSWWCYREAFRIHQLITMNVWTKYCGNVEIFHWINENFDLMVPDEKPQDRQRYLVLGTTSTCTKYHDNLSNIC